MVGRGASRAVRPSGVAGPIQAGCAALLASLVAALVLLPPPVASAGGKKRAPDLALSALSGLPQAAIPGQKFDVRLVAKNVGRKKAGGSRVDFLLSDDRKSSRGDSRIGRSKLKALKPGKRRRLRATLALPADAVGDRHLIACAKRLGKESREKNNCVASKERVAIASPGDPTPQPPSTDPTSPTGPGPATPAPDPTQPAGSDPPAAGSGADPAAPVDPADPRSVTPSVDRDREQAALIGPGGGTVSATGADGSTYTLTVPAGALFGPTSITMAPLVTVDGLPFSGGLAAGVDLQPHGLRLNEPATLKFEPASTPPSAQRTPFGYAEQGKDLRLQAYRAGSAGLELSLSHFSGYGLASGTAAERAEQAAHPPSNPEAQLEQRAAQAQEDPGLLSSWTAYLRDYYRQVVRPRLLAAETDEQLAGVAIQGYFAWLRATRMLSSEDEFASEIEEGRSSFRAIIDFAYDRAVRRCQDGDLASATAILNVAHLGDFLGVPVGGSPLADFDACVRLTLDFEAESRLTYTASDLHQVTRGSALLPLTLDASFSHLEGEMALQIDEYSAWRGSGACGVAPVRVEQSSPFRARVVLGLSERQATDAEGRARTLPPDPPSVHLQPGNLQEFFRYTGADWCGSSEQGNYNYSYGFTFIQGERLRTVDGYGGYLFAELQPGQAPMVASFAESGESQQPGSEFELDVSILLSHTPSQPG